MITITRDRGRLARNKRLVPNIAWLDGNREVTGSAAIRPAVPVKMFRSWFVGREIARRGPGEMLLH